MRTAIYFFDGLDVEIWPKWTLPGSAPTHPRCLSTTGGAIGSSLICFTQYSHEERAVEELRSLQLSCGSMHPPYFSGSIERIPIAQPRMDKQLRWVGAEPGRVHFGRISTSSP